MFILLSSLLAFSETKEEMFIGKINIGITTLSNYCQLRFDVEAESDTYPGRLVFSHENREKTALLITEFQETDANFSKECAVRSKDIFIYDKKDRDRFDFIKENADYVLDNTFYYLVKDYPGVFIFHCLDCENTKDNNFEKVYENYKNESCKNQ